MEEWKVIVSSRSGKGRASKVWEKASSILKRKGVSFSASITEYQYHAIELARKAVLAGYRKIMAVGGDGAIHEVLNGVMSQNEVPSNEVTLAILPVGSGNDWPRLHRIPNDVEDAVRIILNGRTMVQDTVRVESVRDGRPLVRYMANIGGLGFDSYVCFLFDNAKMRGRAGAPLYFKSLLKGFFGYRCKDFRIRVDGEEFFSGKALSVALGNGCYCGGGMMQTPDADCQDGLLDITVIKQMWKPKLLCHIKKLYNGKITQVSGVTAARSSSVIEIDSDPGVYLEIDGESCGCTPVTARIVPHAINVITNR